MKLVDNNKQELSGIENNPKYIELELLNANIENLENRIKHTEMTMYPAEDGFISPVMMSDLNTRPVKKDEYEIKLMINQINAMREYKEILSVRLMNEYST